MAPTDLMIRNAKAADKQQKLFDGGGLFLLLSPAGGKRWVLRYRFGGKEKSLALGTYPGVSLVEARKRREDAREKLAHIVPLAIQTVTICESCTRSRVLAVMCSPARAIANGQ